MDTTQLILVNEQDEQVGTIEKMQAHREGLLHRAFSVFIFDRQGKMLLQQRAASKYHGALLWSNACCSHPFPGETVEAAADRRLEEELGFKTSLEKIFAFTYRAEVENGLVEHEYDHVFVGIYEGETIPDTEEVAEVRYLSLQEVKQWMHNDPAKFTSWFRLVFDRVEAWWEETMQRVHR